MPNVFLLLGFARSIITQLMTDVIATVEFKTLTATLVVKLFMDVLLELLDVLTDSALEDPLSPLDILMFLLPGIAHPVTTAQTMVVTADVELPIPIVALFPLNLFTDVLSPDLLASTESV